MQVRAHVVRIITFVMVFSLLAAGGWSERALANEVLRLGAKGPQVVLAQHFLYQLGLLRSAPDGMFGPNTLEAVKQFQRERRLVVDGIIGSDTWAELHDAMLAQSIRVHIVKSGDTLWDIARANGVSVEAIARFNEIARPSLIRPGEELLIPPSESAAARAATQVELVHWNEAQKIYSNFTVATVTDVWTGKKFQVRRYYGHLHADSEPLTAKDAQTLREIYGGWSWDRRPVILEVDGRKIAASMNGVPHGQGSIEGNGFPGHFCIHFLGSRIHASGNIDIRHQTAVLEAAGYQVSDLWLAHN